MARGVAFTSWGSFQVEMATGKGTTCTIMSCGALYGSEH
ncbi:hypothetical protein MTR67_023230, partial [Solanum verrucosum]